MLARHRSAFPPSTTTPTVSLSPNDGVPRLPVHDLAISASPRYGPPTEGSMNASHLVTGAAVLGSVLAVFGGGAKIVRFADSKVDGLRKEIGEVRRDGQDALKDIRGDVKDIRTEMRDYFNELREANRELREGNRQVSAKLDNLATEILSMEHRVFLLEEGLSKNGRA